MSRLSTSAPLLPEALAEGKRFFANLPDVPAPGFDRIYLHWSVEAYNCTDGAYNAEVYLPDGSSQFAMLITHDPRGNVAGTPQTEASHTYKRNTGAFGIAISGLVGASYNDLGGQPVTLHEEEFLCACAAAVAAKYGIQADSSAPGKFYPDHLANEKTIMTHAEAALTTPSGSYGHYYCYSVNPWRENNSGDSDCRWDLAEDEASGIAPNEDAARAHGDVLRARIKQYKDAINATIADSSSLR